MRNEKSILKYQIRWLIYQTYWQYMILDILQKNLRKTQKRVKLKYFRFTADILESIGNLSKNFKIIK